MERRTVRMALTRMSVPSSVTPQGPSTVLAAPRVLGPMSAAMGCHSVPMPRTRWAAGAPHRTVPCAATLPPAASPRAGCAMAMLTAWITPTSRDACRRSAAHLNSPAAVGSAWPWLCAAMGTLIAVMAQMRRAVPCPGLCCAAQARWPVPTVESACLRPGAATAWLTAGTAQMSRAVPWRTSSAVNGSGAVRMAMSASLTPGGVTERATAVMAATRLAAIPLPA